MQIQISMPQPYALSSADSKVRLKSHVLGTLLLIILGFLNPTLASVAQARRDCGPVLSAGRDP